MLGELKSLFEHMSWADALVWGSVLKSDRTAADVDLQERLYHIHVAQHAFLGIWRGERLDLPKVSDFKTLGAVSAWGRGYHDKVRDYLDNIEESSLYEPIHIPWSKMIEERLGQTPQPTTLYETLLQVTYHSTYHRGQVNSCLRGLGVDPPLTDWIAWVWLGRPPADWPTRSHP